MRTFKPPHWLSQENLLYAKGCGVDLLHILHKDLDGFSEECGKRFIGILNQHAEHARLQSQPTLQITLGRTFAPSLFCDVSGSLFMVHGMYDHLLESYAAEFAEWVRMHGVRTPHGMPAISTLVATHSGVVAHVQPLASVTPLRATSH